MLTRAIALNGVPAANPAAEPEPTHWIELRNDALRPGLRVAFPELAPRVYLPGTRLAYDRTDLISDAGYPIYLLSRAASISASGLDVTYLSTGTTNGSGGWGYP